ncbi:hypothetical protein MLD38_030289 [Melastoma candidum]|uniref:Uncharacterized protein n=1 Tax=Melastoma candidum TaxID=119954 RepID=A0ACB9MKU8_9MYRT|nr:hypothetical protein MLD38_030289 [Melastoma candidum]
MEELDVLASDAMESIIVVIILGVLFSSMLFMFFPWGPDSEYSEYICLSDPATTGARPNKSRRPSAAKKETLVPGVDPVDRRASLGCEEDAPTGADAGDMDRDGPSGNGTGETKDWGHSFNDDNDGWELVERSQLLRDFERAVKFVDGQTSVGIVELSDDEKSRFEGCCRMAACAVGTCQQEC